MARRGDRPQRAWDAVDRIVSEWAVERPDLPVAPIEIINRVGRLRARFDEELSALFARHDLTQPDFTVMAALRRAGSPYQLPQTALMHRIGLTSGTVSVRLARLETKGVISRTPSADDARSVLVSLTPDGLALFDEVAPAHLDNEELLLSALTGTERDQLAGLLRRLLVGFEHEEVASTLGMTLAPAHIARQRRRAVGLPDPAGLLVVDVAVASAAAQAGLRTGDLLLEVDGQELRSCLTLADAGTTAPAGGTLHVTLLRGARRLAVTLTTQGR